MKGNYFARRLPKHNWASPAIVAAYDTIEKKIIGVFKSTYQCDKYFFLTQVGRHSTVFKCIKQKSKDYTNRFNSPVAFRYAKTEYQQMLGEENFIILNENWKK